jgi:valyl-tRNA synthetase
MEKTYDPQDIEQRSYARWEASGSFAPAGDGPAYCIMIPPPNVTGTLHMGHAFQDTIMDALTRYHRMLRQRHAVATGHRPRGHCHADGGRAPAQRRGTEAHDLGRERFVERVWQWKEQSGGTITSQLQAPGRLGRLEPRPLHDGCRSCRGP